ncbi:MAG: hypothetical protein IT215_03290 [Chitinophagaceae bacterium]|nr:MAG: hypothetical protein UZ11_BCD004000349 [Bacteroidetes bacterium OLB11]MCC6447689.1 hypothetical protein [Chitinophagaceae bacterium]HMN32314.1 hypothetical protein [Chitinophagaceae bacterium]
MRINFINISIKTLISCLFIQACSTNNVQLLQKKWKSVELRNPQMDEELRLMKIYIDTVSRQAPMMQKTDIDSLKKALQFELDEMLKQQHTILENTLMEFQSNGVVYITSIDGVDSALYRIEEGDIVVDEVGLKGYGEMMKFKILSLTQDSLSLKTIIYGDTSYVNLIPIKN